MTWPFMAKRSRDRRRRRNNVDGAKDLPTRFNSFCSGRQRFGGRLVAAAIVGLIVGCSDAKPAATVDSPKPVAPKTASTDEPDQPAARLRRPSKFQPVELGDSAGGAPLEAVRTTEAAAAEVQSTTVVAALQPFQILLGQWRWVTKKKFGDFPRRGEDLDWVWDFRSDKGHPALAAHSATNPYYRELRLTYLSDEATFQLTVEDENKNRRLLRGTWTNGGQPKEESDGKRLQRSYRIQLTQVEPAAGEQWQMTLSQLDNNQYVVDLKKRTETGKTFGPLDVLNQQRVGTSFALADSDNPGPKCIISGGLGSMSVTYRGKSYPVCCTGCAAAFNDDPERWLARLAKDRAKQ